MKFLGFSLLLFFGVVAFVTVLVAGVIKIVSQALKDAVSIFKGSKKSQNKTYYYGDNFKREHEDEDITIIDVEIVKDSLLKPYITDVKSANKTNNDDEIKTLLNELTDILQSMDNYIANHRDKEDDIKMMAEYYIPEMLSHLKTYHEMCSSKFKSRHEEAVRHELIDTIKMIKDAFATVLSEFYDNMALNTSSSLEALKASIKMKGYVK